MEANTKSGKKFIGFKIFVGFVVLYVLFGLYSQTENYSEGERIGFVTKFSHKGVNWKSWEGELNVTQTGMNSSSLFDFSIDNNNENPSIIALIDSAANYGWKIKVKYHQTYFKNWFKNRGETDYFINNVEVLDRHSLGSTNSSVNPNANQPQGHIIDTVYVVIDKDELIKKMKEKKSTK